MDMRNMFIYFFFLPMICFSQISKTTKLSDDIDKSIPIFVEYDSLASINKNNYHSHIGQTVYFKEHKPSEVGKRYGSIFYSFEIDKNFIYQYAPSIKRGRDVDIPIDDFMKFFNSTVRTSNNPLSYNYNTLKDKTYVVNNIFEGRCSAFDRSVGRVGFMELIRTDTKDTVYLKYNPENMDMPEYMLTVGYVDKLKSQYLNKIFVCQSDVVFRNYYDRDTKVNLQKNTRLKTVDFSIDDDGKEYPLVAVLADSDDNRVFVPLHMIQNTDIFSSWEYKEGGFRECRFNFQRISKTGFL